MAFPSWPASHAFFAVPVTIYARGAEWVERLLARPPDLRPREGEAVWHVAPSASIYVVADPVRAGTANVVLAVPDLEAERSALAARGMPFATEGAGATLKMIATDPDGNRVAFFQEPETER